MSADGAEEVFKTVSRAFACLSDPNKRAAFDRYGSEDPQQAGFGRGGTCRNGLDSGLKKTTDPADIFNMFFNGGMPVDSRTGSVHIGGNPWWTPVRRTSFRAHGSEHEGASDPRVDDTATVIRNILHLAPLLIPLIMWLFTPVERDFALPRSRNIRPMKAAMDLFYASRGEFNRKFATPSQEKRWKRIENEISPASLPVRLRASKLDE